jgi:hypothetical protein
LHFNNIAKYSKGDIMFFNLFSDKEKKTTQALKEISSIMFFALEELKKSGMPYSQVHKIRTKFLRIVESEGLKEEDIKNVKKIGIGDL